MYPFHSFLNFSFSTFVPIFFKKNSHFKFYSSWTFENAKKIALKCEPRFLCVFSEYLHFLYAILPNTSFSQAIILTL